jgi:hypothetical protein
VKRYKQSLELERHAAAEREDERKQLEEELMQVRLSYERKKRKTVALKSQKKALEGMCHPIEICVKQSSAYVIFRLCGQAKRECGHFS